MTKVEAAEILRRTSDEIMKPEDFAKSYPEWSAPYYKNYYKVTKLIFFKSREEREEFIQKIKEVAIIIYGDWLTNYEMKTSHGRVKFWLLEQFHTLGLMMPHRIIFYNCSPDDCEDEYVRLSLKHFKNISTVWSST